MLFCFFLGLFLSYCHSYDSPDAFWRRFRPQKVKEVKERMDKIWAFDLFFDKNSDGCDFRLELTKVELRLWCDQWALRQPSAPRHVFRMASGYPSATFYHHFFNIIFKFS